MRVFPTSYTGRPLAQCIRCGWQWHLDEMRKEWSGSTVCPKCWDPRPDTLNPPNVRPEGLPVIDAQPAQPLVFVSRNITPEDL